MLLKKAIRCNACNRTHRRLYVRPPLYVLELEVDVIGVVATGKKYGVYSKTIRNWISDYKNNNDDGNNDTKRND